MKSLLTKTTKILAAALLFGAVSANAFTEGKDYIVLEKPLSVENGTLTKVFSYACPFCYKYDKSVTPKVVEKVADLKYMPYHLKTKAEYGEAASKILAVLAVKDEAKGISWLDFKKAKFAYYKAYHDKKERWGGGKDIEAFLKTGLEAAGITMDEYKKELENPKVIELLKKWDESYDAAKIQGVPAFIVNGKYLIYTSSITSVEGFASLIEELLKK
ncbi:thiol:disulfide interchange protein DsbA/DsbL [Campylobacter sp. RM16187]|uniref:thiol:disulfide interchange protein DsbA/DsbL n=1 Tax=Campylobacter sp. RM16187 TaxID=1660063 RepID=UPI0021B69DD7|nr:thiol:disulfide interchange protein DsbA/DsbL [Campylobacter sp. RM16187]QKG28508.1 protein disulfide oxidoreductase [Campylobacter sp. RM16187]